MSRLKKAPQCPQTTLTFCVRRCSLQFSAALICVNGSVRESLPCAELHRSIGATALPLTSNVDSCLCPSVCVCVFIKHPVCFSWSLLFLLESWGSQSEAAHGAQLITVTWCLVALRAHVEVHVITTSYCLPANTNTQTHTPSLIKVFICQCDCWRCVAKTNAQSACLLQLVFLIQRHWNNPADVFLSHASLSGAVPPLPDLEFLSERPLVVAISIFQ